MTNLVLAFCAFALQSAPGPVCDRSALMFADLPLTAPAGWKSEKSDGSVTFTPGDVPAGKLFMAIATPTEGKAGSLDEVLDNGKTVAGQIGTFKSTTEPSPFKSDGGWDYEFVVGTVEKSGRTFAVQVFALKKGDDGGVVVVLSDSLETMAMYAEPFVNMIRDAGGAPKHVSGPTGTSSGTADLQYTLPPGWVKKDINGSPFLVKEKNEEYNKYRISLLILPTEALSGSIRDQFVGCWNAFVTPNYATRIAPIPLMARLKSGHACAFDADANAVAKNGNVVTVAIFLIAHGGRVVPVMGTFSGPNWNSDKSAEKEVAQFLDSARIPNASSDSVALYTASSLAGDWAESGTEHAMYITHDGGYAGSATSATAAWFTLRSDGSYSRAMVARGSSGNISEKDTGNWSVEDDELVLAHGVRYSLLGYGNDAKVGRFLVLGNYTNTKSRLQFTNPRGLFQAKWLKAK